MTSSDASVTMKTITDGNSNNSIEELCFRISAIRELFEESNVLLASNPQKQNHHLKELEEWRKKTQDDSSKFYEMFISLGLLPQVNSLYPFAHWLTPVVEQYRYNTLFYLTVVDHQYCHAIADNTETTQLNWFTPSEAIQSFVNSQILLPPPTYYMLNQLCKSKTINSLIEKSRFKEFGIDIAPTLPLFMPYKGTNNVVLEKGKAPLFYFVLPGDFEHPTSNNLSPEHLNRTLIVCDENDPQAHDKWRYIAQEHPPSKL